MSYTGKTVAATLVSVLLVALAPACSRDVEYAGVGDVVSIDEPRLHVIIRHDDIPGLMSAMTMRFAVASQPVLDGIAPGDAVRFVVVQRGGQFTLVSITRK
jgi:Cu/Ag efflux protein CusF